MNQEKNVTDQIADFAYKHGFNFFLLIFVSALGFIAKIGWDAREALILIQSDLKEKVTLFSNIIDSQEKKLEDLGNVNKELNLDIIEIDKRVYRLENENGK